MTRIFIIAMALLHVPLSPSVADESVKRTLGWALEGHTNFHEQAKTFVTGYIDGYRNGYVGMFLTQTVFKPPQKRADTDAVEGLVHCVVVNEPVDSIYSRLIEAAKTSPDTPIMIWLKEDFDSHCADQLKIALQE